MTRYNVRPQSKRSVCPGCKRMRFIPIQTVPYCTPSCKRDAIAKDVDKSQPKP